MDQMNYTLGFRRGLEETRYEDDIENIPTPEVDESDFESIGYADGVGYAKYLVMAGMKYAIKEENLIAVIDKGFLTACKKVEASKVKKHI